MLFYYFTILKSILELTYVNRFVVQIAYKLIQKLWKLYCAVIIIYIEFWQVPTKIIFFETQLNHKNSNFF